VASSGKVVILFNNGDSTFASPLEYPAGELARDVQRYLSGEPIEAKRDSAWYVFRKSLRRYKLPIAIAASFVLLISSSTVALSIMYASQSRARRGEAEQRQLAEANQTKAQQEAAKAQQEAARAEHEAAKAQQATRFVQQMLSGVDPEVAGSLDKKLMRMILDDAAARIETELVSQPEVEASIRATIGSTYQAIGEYPRAQAHLEQALEIRQRVLGEEHPDTLGSMNDVAVLYQDQGRYADAETLFKRSLKIREKALGPEHPKSFWDVDFDGTFRLMGVHQNASIAVHPVESYQS